MQIPISEASTDPRIQPSISTINHEDKVIVVITVSPSISAPINMRGKYVRRVGRTNQRINQYNTFISIHIVRQIVRICPNIFCYQII